MVSNESESKPESNFGVNLIHVLHLVPRQLPTVAYSA